MIEFVEITTKLVSIKSNSLLYWLHVSCHPFDISLLIVFKFLGMLRTGNDVYND